MKLGKSNYIDKTIFTLVSNYYNVDVNNNNNNNITNIHALKQI